MSCDFLAIQDFKTSCSAGLDDPCFSGCFLVVDNLFNLDPFPIFIHLCMA